MRSEVLRNLSLVKRPPEMQPDRAEPRLFPVSEPVPLRRPASPNLGDLSVTRAENRKPAVGLSAVSALDRPPASAAARPKLTLSSITLAGAVVLAVSAIGAAGLLRSIGPAKETGNAAPSTATIQPQVDSQSQPVAAPAPPPNPSALPAIPTPPPTKQATADTAVSRAPKSPNNVVPGAKPLPVSALPISAAAATRRIAAHPTSTGAPTNPLASPAPAAREAAQGHRGAIASSSDEHLAHPQIVARHIRLRPYHEARALDPPSPVVHQAESSKPEPGTIHRSEAPKPAARVTREVRAADRQSHPAHEIRSQQPQPRSTEAAAPRQADQAASFARLMTQLTQPSSDAKPAAPAATPGASALTPPAAGAADPFAERGAGGPSAQ